MLHLREILAPFGAFASAAMVVAIALALLWLVSLARRDASIIDSFWGFGFVLVAIASLLGGRQFPPDEAVIGVVALVTLWGLRLSAHLFTRWWREGAEDYRYQKMRAFHGEHFWWRSLFTVFLLQGVLMWLVALPIMAAAQLGGNIMYPFAALAALALALLGLGIETIADSQLKRFRATAKPDDVLATGLWAYSRHPNYFGDAVFWWGIWLAVVATTPALVWTIIAPLIMNYLLVNISGAAMLERKLKKKAAYAAYTAATSRFLPIFFKRK